MSDHDREWIIGCIKHDGFIKTDRFDKANHIILDALEKNIDAEIARLSRPTDLISRADAIEAVKHSTAYMHDDLYEAISIRIPSAETTGALDDAIAKYVADGLMELPSAEAESDDLIIKGAKGIKDGLYNIKDGELFEYKAKGGTVRVYSIVPSADAVCEDTQTEERARFVAKETELAHIEAKLENAGKRLQGACTANFVAEQLERLRNMTDEERWDFLKRFFSPSAEPYNKDAISREGLLKSWEELSPRGRTEFDQVIMTIPALPSAEAVTIHENGTLEVKVPNAQKVGRVLVKDVDSHIGGGLFYPDDAVPQSEQYKKGFEDAKRAYLVEYARESRNMRKRQLEVMLNAQKAISAETVHGEWEHWGSPFSDESEVIDTIVCSVCGARFIEPKDEPKGEYNCCPNCGAIMKGGAE